jgi:hypothetical protein
LTEVVRRAVQMSCAARFRGVMSHVCDALDTPAVHSLLAANAHRAAAHSQPTREVVRSFPRGVLQTPHDNAEVRWPTIINRRFGEHKKW